MDSEVYSERARMTMKDESDPQERLMNAALGLAGESGEVCDMVKKYRYHGHELDMTDLIKELGDIQWYIVQACIALGITLDYVMQYNNEKLAKRYKTGFNSVSSINREEYRLMNDDGSNNT